MTRYLVTTPGLSATRWVSFALALHPEVFAAHGKFGLHSLDGTHAARSRQTDRDSLTHGNELREFYSNSSLEEVFAAYRGAAPGATVHGSVHSFTIHELQQRRSAGESLEGVQIINLTRHPVSYIDSHIALIRSAEHQPDLAAHYRQLLKDAVAFCPEARLVECPEPMAGLAAVASFYSAFKSAQDLITSEWSNVRMEDITTDVESLQRFCEQVTGLSYAGCDLQGHISQGSMNSHRKGKGFADPQEIFNHWPHWQRDLFAIFMTPELLDQWRLLGYSVSSEVTAGPTPATAGSSGELTPPCCSDLTCVGDFSLELGLNAERPAADLVEAGFLGYNLLSVGTGAVALTESLGPVDWRTVSQRSVNLWQAEGKCLEASTLDSLRRAIQTLPPQLLDSDYSGYNLVRFRGNYLAIAQALGPFDLSDVSPEKWREWEASQSIIKSDQLDRLYELLDQQLAPRLVESIGRFNLISWSHKIFALSQEVGDIDLPRLTADQQQHWVDAGLIIVGDSHVEVRERLLPRLRAAGYAGFNLVSLGQRNLAVAEILGPVDLACEQAAVVEEWKHTSLCLEGDTLEQLKLEVQLREPQVLVPDYCGFDILTGAGRIIGVSKSVGPISRADLNGRQVQSWAACGQWVEGRTIAEVQNAIQLMPSRVLRQNFLGWNLIASRGRLFAIPVNETPGNAAELSERLQRLCKSDDHLAADSLAEIEHLCEVREFQELHRVLEQHRQENSDLRSRLRDLEVAQRLPWHRKLRTELGRVARGIRRRLPFRRAA